MTTKDTTGYFEALLDFDDRYFHLAEDCVGAKIPFKFNSHQYAICLPNFDFEKLDGFGHPQPTSRDTRIGLNWLETQQIEGEDYARAYSYNPETKKILKFSCNRLIIRSKLPVTAVQARQARKELPAWKQLFSDWLEASEYTNLEDGGVKVEQADNIRAYYLPVAKPKKSRRIKSKDQSGNSITVSMYDGFTVSSLDRALKLASTGQTPPGYYQQIVSALKYFHKEEHRQCVLDAATAFEMALIQMLDVRLSHLGREEKKLIEDKYRQIVGLSDGLRKLGCDVPTSADIRQKLAEPRNSAIHKGKVVSKVEAQEALYFAKDFIYSKFPL